MIAVIDYGIGNLRSAEKALLHLGADARLTADATEIARADQVVLPLARQQRVLLSAADDQASNDVDDAHSAGPLNHEGTKKRRVHGRGAHATKDE